MNYRHAVVLANTDYGPSGTEPINIDIKRPISAITVVHQPVGGSDTPAAHPAKNIEKLEIVEGAKPLYSLTGTQGQAVNCFEAKRPIIQEIDYRNGGTPLTYVLTSHQAAETSIQTSPSTIPSASSSCRV